MPRTVAIIIFMHISFNIITQSFGALVAGAKKKCHGDISLSSARKNDKMSNIDKRLIEMQTQQPNSQPASQSSNTPSRKFHMNMHSREQATTISQAYHSTASQLVRRTDRQTSWSLTTITHNIFFSLAYKMAIKDNHWNICFFFCFFLLLRFGG